MKIRQIVAVGLVAMMAGGTLPVSLAAAQNQTASVSGTAKNEAKRPYTDYTVRARNVQQGQIGGSVPLDANANFSLTNLPPAIYSIELVNRDGKVVCT